MMEDKDSYRPINNLSVVNKVIEQFFKHQIMDFMNDIGIILEDRHGSRKEHSILTALSLLSLKLS